MNDTEREPRWYSKSEQWKIIPICFLMVGIERTFTGINLLNVKETWFGTLILVVGILCTAGGAILLCTKAQRAED